MSRQSSYQKLLKATQSLITLEDNNISNMANFCALLKEEFDWHWIGFYLVDEGNKELYLGPFQGPLACTKIPHGKGVCGTSWAQAQTLNVPDVHQFPGHIACSSHSNSEIVIPVKVDGKVVAVLDIDSTSFSDFTTDDQKQLELLIQIIEDSWS
jgi:L-methionine (R)-S-oxide reductase